MKPVALIIVGPDGVRLETVRGSTASVIDKAIDTLSTTVPEGSSPA